MGTGKTTVGRHLSQVLGMSFLDTDHVLQERTGVDIPTIFEFEGETGFRDREERLLEELTQHNNQILATGGGIVLRESNRKNLSSRGVVVYLHCKPEQQYQRTFKDKNRPLLQTENPLKKLKDLMSQRDPLYREIADYIVSTEGRSAHAVVKEIVSLLKSA